MPLMALLSVLNLINGPDKWRMIISTDKKTKREAIFALAKSFGCHKSF